ncbi:MBL fold metallo-hydrolase [Parathermosynechococcus lividus]
MAQQQKLPRPVLPMVYAFAPNRQTLGGTAYLIVEKDGNTLIDTPFWAAGTTEWLAQQGPLKRLILTHRGAIAHVREFQHTFGCEVVIHAQEAYLLPHLTVTTVEDYCTLTPTLEVLWTPGHSPGSSCVYWREQGGVLFSGRHLLPSADGDLLPLKTATTFHWPRQLRSVRTLQHFCAQRSLAYLCPGANLGFLRGAGVISNAQDILQSIPIPQGSNTVLAP